MCWSSARTTVICHRSGPQMTPLTPPPLSPLLDAPRQRPRGRRAWFAVLFVIVLAGGVAATAAAVGVLRPGTLPGLPGASAGPGLVVEDPVGVRPNPSPGPDLGEGWATPPDPDRFVTIEDGTRVADDQYLVMLEPGATANTAQRLADSVHG